MSSVSIILVTYQSAGCLLNCLTSLERVAEPEQIELILVDNHSQDQTWPLICDYAARVKTPFERIHTLRLKENRGYAYANNRGLALATGEVLLLLNPDTVVGRDAIAKCVERLSSPGLGAVGCRLEMASGQLDRACRRSFPTLWNSFCRFSGLARAFPHAQALAAYNLTYLDDRGSYPLDCVSGAYLLVSRAAYEKTGGFDEDYFLYGEDIDWCYRIKQQGYAIWYEGSVTTIHLKGGNGGKRTASSLRHFYQTMALFFQKHYQTRYPRSVLTLVKLSLYLLYHTHVAWLQIIKSRR